MSFNKSVFMTMGLLSSLAFAKQEMTVAPNGAPVNPMSDFSISGATQRTTNNNYSIRFRASCFGVNLRGVANPVSPESIITMSGKMKVDNSADANFTVKFPAKAVLGGSNYTGADTAALPSSDTSGLPASAKAGISGNLIQVKFDSSVTNSIDPVTAEIKLARSRFDISDLSFSQEVPSNGGAYMANNGPLSTGSIKVNKSSDGKTIDLEASFPGQNGYCGGYYSPLMVFFDSARPQFKNIVTFQMNTGLKTYWPEKSHAGYFLGFLKNGKINSVDQLFGENKNFSNGFDNLAQHDKNKDGVIDSKDPIFKKLVLWKDNSGVGKFSAKDAFPVAKKIKSIDLAYNPNIESMGETAEFRQKSKFTFKDSSGQWAQGEIVDVWFKPALGTEDEAKDRKLSSLGQ